MKFIRRPDLDKVTRTEIAVQAFHAQGVYGEITRLARASRVSRWFVYALLWQLTDLFATSDAVTPASRYTQTDADRHLLLLRMVGRSSLESIACICASWVCWCIRSGTFRNG